MPEAPIEVEVVYAAVDRQVLIRIELPSGSTVRHALQVCGIEQQFPGLDLSRCAVGIFGKVVSEPELRVLVAGDRVEIYRPLLADPKEVRRLRAARAARARSGDEPV